MTTATDPIVIVGAARTPMGGFQGELKDLTASELGAAAIRAALTRAGVDAADVEEVVMGCVLPAGQGQAPAFSADDLMADAAPPALPAATVRTALFMTHPVFSQHQSEHQMLRAPGTRALEPTAWPSRERGRRRGAGGLELHRSA